MGVAQWDWSSDCSFLEWLVRLVGVRVGLAVRGEELREFVRHEQVGLETRQKIAREVIGRSTLEHYGLEGAWRAFRDPVIQAVERRTGSYELALEAVALVVEHFFGPQQGAMLRSEGERARRVNFPLALMDLSPGLDELLLSSAGSSHVKGLNAAVAISLEEFRFRASRNVVLLGSKSRYEEPLQLGKLFGRSASIVEGGRFFDQRLINYLASNFDEIGRIDWRKFEELVAEHFHRSGFTVELGPGSNDDGVDLRVWTAGETEGRSPTFLVQCKREKRKVGKVVVKALAADVAWEGAEQGLLVSTSEWLPGARAVAKVRGYPVREVNASHVQSWVLGMREVGTGIWLATDY